ncbi:uncharacterized protein LOC119354842 [Triticum dicoccoides]|uniref:uncharacterized protein LOC119354842 n=1 Tax=Triticum dicoccoides TaxID=85692 RepID=UPI00188FA05F|nr:uncharacterized protein LOC119354842 [Triticum dicoccoides]
MIFDAPGGPTLWRSRRNERCPRFEEMNEIISLPICDSLGGELINFSFRGRRTRLVVIYLNTEEDDEDPLDEALYGQRTRLGDDEMDNLWKKLLPRDAYAGMPFVSHLTRTNIIRHVMKLPTRLSVSCDIEPDEADMARLRLTTRGSITTCAYAVDTDDCTVLSMAGWNNFLAGKNLCVGQVILVTIRNTPRVDLRMMIIIDLI